MARCIRRLLRDESGATAIEYGVIAASIALALIPVISSIGSSLNALFGTIAGWF